MSEDLGGKKIYDQELCLERLDDDLELLLELIEVYVEDAPNIFSRLSQALEGGDLESAEREAHSMKSASANVGAERTREVSRLAEIAAREKRSEDVAGLFARMKQEFDCFVKEVASVA
jgi:HPt (histidine-containing phosphotransfer) domain-containing protein